MIHFGCDGSANTVVGAFWNSRVLAFLLIPKLMDFPGEISLAGWFNFAEASGSTDWIWWKMMEGSSGYHSVGGDIWIYLVEGLKYGLFAVFLNLFCLITHDCHET